MTDTDIVVSWNPGNKQWEEISPSAFKLFWYKRVLRRKHIYCVSKEYLDTILMDDIQSLGDPSLITEGM